MQSEQLYDSSPLAQHMPTAVLLVRGLADGSSAEDTLTSDIIAGAKAYVRAAVSMVLGACESHHGPTCIVGDTRRNVLLTDPSWAEALERDLDAGPDKAASMLESEEGHDEYPDL